MQQRRPLLIMGLIGLCAPMSALGQVPYTQNFDAFPLCGTSCSTTCNLAQGWSNLPGANADWLTRVGRTGSSNTGPTRDHTSGTGRYLYTEGTGCSFRRAEAATPTINFTGASSPVLSFWYHMWGSNMGQLHVDVIRDPAGAAVRTNDIMPPIVGDQGNQWRQIACVPLDGTAPAQVIFRGIMGNSFRTDMAIDDIEVRNLPGVDVAVVDATVAAGCANTAGTVSVELENLGGTVNSIPITVTVNGVVAFTETVNTTLQACGTGQTVNLQTPLTLPAGPATVVVSAAVPGDAVANNNAVTRTVQVQPVVSSFPYAQGFEAANHGWVTTGAGSSWARGLPADAVIDSAFNGSNAFVTNLTGDYSANEISVLEGPCYDFSALTNPRFEARVWWESESNRDGAQVQVSTDNGASWQTVGTSFTTGWYNQSSIVALQSALSNGYGFGGRVDTNNGSGGWVRVGHDLGNNTAGATAVRVRVVFASNVSIQDEGFAIDDVRLADNLPRVELVEAGSPTPVVAASPGETNRYVLGLDATAVLGPNSVTGLTVTRRGTSTDADVSGITIWRDDGDQRFEPNQDQRLGTATFVAGQAAVTFTSPLSLVLNQTRRVFVSLDVAPAATAGAGIALELTSIADVVGPQRVDLPSGPATSPTHRVVTRETALPFGDGFEGPVPASRTAQLRGAHPTATSTNAAVVTAAAASNPAQVSVVASYEAPTGTLSPRTGAGMFLVDFPAGPGVGSLDYGFDLSTLDPNQDDVFFEVAVRLVDQTADDADGVFVSADGGQTWVAALHSIRPSSSSGWRLLQADLSAAFRAAGQSFTSDVLVRVQAAGGGAQGPMLVDDAWMGVPERIGVRFMGASPTFSGQAVNVGSAPGGTTTTATFEVVNLGQRDLQFQRRFLVRNGSNVSGVSTSGTGPTTLAPGVTSQINIFFTPIASTFGFEVGFPASDPRLAGGEFVLPLFGMGVVEPEIELRIEGGAVVASGSTEDVGALRVGGDTVRRRYEISSLGSGLLDLTGMPPVRLENEVNVNAAVLGQPATPIAPGFSESFGVDFSPAARGAFSFDVVVASTDADEGEIRFSFTGEGTSPEFTLSRDGMDVPNGTEEDLGTLLVGESTTFVYTISNTGNFPLRLIDLPRVRVLAVTNVQTNVVDAAVNTLEPGATVDFEVTVAPREDGDFRADMIILTDDDDEGEVTVRLVGVGRTPQPDLQVARDGAALAPDAEDPQGAHATGETRTLEYTLSNVGERVLEFSGDVTVDEVMNVDVQVMQASSSTLTPGASQTFSVTYTPEADGDFQFRMRVFSNDPDPALYRILVTGSASTIVPDLAVEQPAGSLRRSGALLRIREVEVGKVGTMLVTLRNTGTGPLTFADTPVTFDELDNVEASLAMQPATTLDAGAAVEIELNVTPAALGAFSASMHVLSDDPDSPDFTLKLSGTGIPQSDLAEDEGGCTCVRPSAAPPLGLALGLIFFVTLRRRRR